MFSGIYGYSAYSGGKWAVRGLAESLVMELVGTGVSLTLAFPPDTDTPGFEKEELTKPEETKLISGSGGLHSPNYVGRQLVNDALVIVIIYFFMVIKKRRVIFLLFQTKYIFFPYFSTLYAY